MIPTRPHLYPLSRPGVFGEGTSGRSALFRFVVVSDTHYGLNAPRPGGQYDERMQMVIDNLIAETDSDGLDFYIVNGDIIHGENFADNVQALTHVKDEFLAQVGVPFYLTRGNHDLVTPEEWLLATDQPINYAFEVGGFGFVLLDSSSKTGARQICLDEDLLEESLNAFANKRGVFFVSHIPRYKGGFLTNPATDSPQCDEIMELISGAGNVVAMLHGHFHAQDGMYIKDGIPVFFDSHVSNYGTNYWGYRRFEVYRDRVLTQQWDMVGKRVVNEYEIQV